MRRSPGSRRSEQPARSGELETFRAGAEQEAAERAARASDAFQRAITADGAPTGAPRSPTSSSGNGGRSPPEPPVAPEDVAPPDPAVASEPDAALVDGLAHRLARIEELLAQLVAHLTQAPNGQTEAHLKDIVAGLERQSDTLSHIVGGVDDLDEQLNVLARVLETSVPAKPPPEPPPGFDRLYGAGAP